MKQRCARLFTIAGFATLLVLASSSPSHGQATTYINPLDEAYTDIQTLVAAGLVDRVFVGQRPYSRLEFAHIVNRADEALGRRDTLEASTRYLRDLVATIRERLALANPNGSKLGDSSAASLVRTFPLRAASLDYTQTDGPTRRIPVSNGLGQIDASMNPLIAERLATPLVDGWNLTLMTNHVVETKHFAASVSPGLVVQRDPSGGARVDAWLQDFQLRFLTRNFALDVGREYALWGQSYQGGLLGSTSAPPLDQVRVSNERPFTPPWVLRYLGPTKITAFYSNLGAAQNYPYPYFIGYKISIVPTSRLELGFTSYTKAGGEGAPSASLGARLVDLFPFINRSFYAGVIGVPGAYEFSDHYAGADMRWRVPGLRGAELYWELIFNDFDIKRLSSVLWEDAGHVAGLNLPRLTPDGRLGASIEYHHTGIRYFEHHQFTTGMAFHGTVIGDLLGPDGQGAYGNVRWAASPWRRFRFDAALERRSHDEYQLLPLPFPQFRFGRTLERPKEWRMRAVASWNSLARESGLGTLAEVGYERVRNFYFVEGSDRNNFLARLGLEYRYR